MTFEVMTRYDALVDLDPRSYCTLGPPGWYLELDGLWTGKPRRYVA